MKLSRPVKVLVGAVTLWPLAYMVGFFVLVFGGMAWGLAHQGQRLGHPEWAGVGFLGLMVVHVATMFLGFALTAFYIVFVFKSDRVPADKKALWAVVLFLGSMVAEPIFFVLYIWPEEWPKDGVPEPVSKA